MKAIEIPYSIYQAFSNLPIFDEFKDITQLKTELEKYVLMPNQMLYGATYNPLNLFFAKNVDKVMGCKKKDLLVGDFVSRIHHEDTEIVYKQVIGSLDWVKKNPFEAENAIFSLKYRIKHFDGHYLNVQRNTKLLNFNCETRQIISMSLVTDISALKETPFKASASISNYVTGQVFLSIDNNHPKFKISKRERDVLKLLSQGLSSSEIAKKLFLSKHTVDGHRRKLLEKTNTSNTRGLVSLALKEGYL